MEVGERGEVIRIVGFVWDLIDLKGVTGLNKLDDKLGDEEPCSTARLGVYVTDIVEEEATNGDSK